MSSMDRPRASANFSTYGLDRRFLAGDEAAHAQNLVGEFKDLVVVHCRPPSAGSVGAVAPVFLDHFVEQFAHVVEAVLFHHEAAHPDQLPARAAHLAIGPESNEAFAGLSAA